MTVLSSMKAFNKGAMFVQTRQTINAVSSNMIREINQTVRLVKPSEAHKRLLTVLKEMCQSRVKGYVPAYLRTQLVTWMRQSSVCASFPPKAAFGAPLVGGVTSIPTTVENLELNDGISETFQKTLKESLASAAVDTCPVCLFDVDKPTVTTCGHVFCFECIHAALAHQGEHYKRCPVCRAQLHNSVLHEIKSENEADVCSDKVLVQDLVVGASEVLKGTIEDLKTYAAEANGKVGAIQDWLFEAQHAEKKLIIFTGFYDALAIVEDGLKAAGIPHVTVKANMPKKQRAQSLDSFKNDPTVKVFLATTRFQYDGNALSVASTIMFLEPCTSQPMYVKTLSKVDRLGQISKTIDVVTLVTENSVDERLVGIRKGKLTLKDVGLT
jgi:SNF2 family DNA or RNA helicase